jgi:UDPglucose 6-dehydrogenase/GDP-mannose 6-dehydrogenase
MKISIVGAGYVGLVSGVCLAEKGHQVICIDRDYAKVDLINSGKPPIYERDLVALLQKNLSHGFSATTDLTRAIQDTEFTLIAVGTPFNGQRIDLTAVEQASREIGAALKKKSGYHVVVVKSTVVPGTTDEVVRPILEAASGKRAEEDFGVGMNPEFLREGEAISDFMEPDRIVYGGIDARSVGALRELYSVFPSVDLIETNCRTAEMIKYTANSLLATMISFSNEIANLCSATGNIDVMDVTRAVHLDRRISPLLPDGRRVIPPFTTYIQAGCGFGGSCFPKDVRALIEYGRVKDSPMRILESVMAINEMQPYRLIDILKTHFTILKGLRVVILGFAFKPGTNDIRESPALKIARQLIIEGSKVSGFDPIAQSEVEATFELEAIDFQNDLNSAICNVDAIVIVTRWPEFEAIPSLLKSLESKQPLVIDGRRMLEKNSVAKYDGIGLQSTSLSVHKQ